MMTQRTRRGIGLVVLAGFFMVAGAQGAAPPNILWISCEDISANLGCYGDPHARTPNLDRLASQGVRFTRAFTPAGVCAVVRSGVITGMYPVAIGSHHMRSRIVPPPQVRCFTEYLRAAGYYCTNRSKTDYQFDAPVTAWDQQGNRHNDWRGRAKGQPFFSVVNLTVSHESQIRHGDKRHADIRSKLAPGQIHDPDTVATTLPPYLPDTPAARKNWAWYHDNISEMDHQAGEILKRLEQDGLADSTLVVFWSDHGQGMPRGKRWIYESGVHVPVIMRWPGRLEAGTVRQDLVSVLDLPPTMLSAAGVKVPGYMHGRVVVGKAQPEPKYLFFHRDRMDEAYELMRGVRDRRFKYIRNFEPEKTYAQDIDYMDQMPAMQDWRRLRAEGGLTGPQKNWFARPKPIEELYDIDRDPHEVSNLAADPAQRDRLARMRQALEKWQVRIGDLGLVPEPVLMQSMRPGGAWQVTSRPEAQVSAGPDGNGRAVVTLVCATPGASIAYRHHGGKARPWKLYARPLHLAPGTRLEFRAARLGYRDSPLVAVSIP